MLSFPCCVNASYLCVPTAILFLCFVSTSTDFHSLLYASRLFCSLLFKDILHHLCSFSAYLVISRDSFFHDIYLHNMSVLRMFFVLI